MKVSSSCLLFLTIWLINITGVNAGRILVGVAPDIKSHLGSMMPLLKKLASAGHQITIFHATSDKATDFGTNISSVHVKLEKEDKTRINTMIWTQSLHAHMIGMVYTKISGAFTGFLTNHSENIKETLNTKYDLIIASALFNVHFFAFAEILKLHQNVPIIIFASSNFFSSDAYHNALAQNWVSSPHMFGFEPEDVLDTFETSRFMTRLVNVGEHLGELASMGYVDNVVLSPQVAKLTTKKDFGFLKMYKQSSLKISDMINYLGLPTAIVNDLKIIGAHCGKPSKLPKEFLDFVEDSKSKGTIYIAFGTIVPWDSAPEEIKTVFFDALDQLVDYRIIFAYNGQFPDRPLPPHLKLVKWAPQLDILQHSNTKLVSYPWRAQKANMKVSSSCLLFLTIWLINITGVNAGRILVGVAPDIKSHLGSMMPCSKIEARCNATLIYRDPEMIPTKEIKETLNTKYDLIIASALFNVHFFAFAEILKLHQNVPIIIFASSNFFSSDAYHNALAQNWVSSPHMFGFEPEDVLDTFETSRFMTRLVNVDNVVLSPQVAKLTTKKDFGFLKMYKQSSLKISDMINYLGLPTAIVNDLKIIGAHCGKPSKLPKEFLDFVEDSKSKGTIYIAFGTIVPWDSAPEEIKTVFFDALDQLVDYRIIFAYNGQFPDRPLPPHLKLVKWAPQLDILQHSNTKLFLTHGGLKNKRDSEHKYDLIIASALFNVHFFAFAEILKLHQNVPIIIFASSNFFSSDAYHNALAQNWVSSPHMFGFEPEDDWTHLKLLDL
uniref:glucuronosyltransferase n=1 Tax=Ditylenchus dipsaci TaxID=166011 RepID=A0A915EP93_9BILA